MELLIRAAGIGLLLIAFANVFAPRLFRYRENLARCDRMFGQVFMAHGAYIVVVVVGMAALCLWRPSFFLDHEVGRAMAGFFGLFWGSRCVVQICYYDRELRRKYPLGDIIFFTGFLALGVGFLKIALLP